MTDRELCDIIERVRVECSRHTDRTYALGGIYALDTVKPLLRERLRAEVSSPARPQLEQDDVRAYLRSVVDPYEEFEGNATACRFCFARRRSQRQPERNIHHDSCIWQIARLAEGAASSAPPALDATQAEIQRLQNELAAAQADVARLTSTVRRMRR